MKLDAQKFALSVGLSTAFVWTLCSVLVWLSPGLTMTVTGHMIHADVSDVTWAMTLSSAAIGLVAWTMSAGAMGWLIATVYNWVMK